MNVRCSDCTTTFLLTPDGMTQTAACPNCGGTRLERDQPSPTKSDGDLRDMVDSGYDQDMGGNPLMEGVIGDGGWRPWGKRDESFASVKTADSWDMGDMGFDFSEKVPTHKFVVDQHGKVFSAPEPTTHEEIADTHGLHAQGFPHRMSLGVLHNDGGTEWLQHDTPHSAQALESMLYGHFGMPVQIDPNLRPSTHEERWGLPDPNKYPEFGQPGFHHKWVQEQQAVDQRGRGFGYYDNPFFNRGGSVDRTLDMDVYMPWTHEAEVKEAEVPQQPTGPQHHITVTPGEHGIHAGTVKWLSFLDAHVNGLPARGNMGEIFAKYGSPNSPDFRQPVPISVHHPEHLDAARETVETSAQASAAPPALKSLAMAIHQGQAPAPPGIDPSKLRFGSTKESFLPALALAPLAEAALPMLMRGALMGAGSNAIQGLMPGGDAAGAAPSMPPAQPQDPGVYSKQADLETPHTNPGYHDTDDGDTKQFDDQSTDPNFDNPNVDAEAGGAAQGEDPVGAGIGADKPGFSPGAVERASLLLPALMHYFNSEESAATDPQIRALHDELEREAPGYLDGTGDDDSSVQELFQKLREPTAVAASVHEGDLRDFGDKVRDNLTTPALNTLDNLRGNPSDDGQAFGRNYMKYVREGYSDQEARERAYVAIGTMTPEEFEQRQLMQIPTAEMDEFDPRNSSVHESLAPQPMLNQIDPSQIGVQPLMNPQHDPSQQSVCMYCGGTTMADGTCPQCGAKNGPFGAGGAQDQSMPMAPAAAPGYTAMPMRQAADHQGPVTDEQKKAVAELLIATDRAEEIPHMLEAPYDYAEELAAVANKIDTPEQVDPSEQAPPMPAQEIAPPGATMPVPNPAAPSMSPPMMASVTAADNYAPRCPNCNSATTGLLGSQGDGSISARCHGCGNVWSEGDRVQREKMGSKTALQGENPLAVPAADQDNAPAADREQDNTGTWTTQDGQPLVEGQTYEVHNPKFQIPDIVKVDQIKPDAIVVSTIGEYSNDPNAGPDEQPLTYQHEIPREELESQQLTFIPSDGDSDAGEQHLDEYQDSSQAPTSTEPQPNAPVTDQHIGASESTQEDSEKDGDGSCPKCGSEDMASHLSSATTSYHSCYRCGHGWETREADFSDQNTAGRDWIMNDSGPGGDDFFAEMERHKAMRQSGLGSRSLADAASRDPRLQAIKERLNENAQQKEAGRKYTPREQREFIDEQGVARNSDKLDLAGTHYEARHRYVDRGAGRSADPDGVREEDLFLGV